METKLTDRSTFGRFAFAKNCMKLGFGMMRLPRVEGSDNNLCVVEIW